MKNILLKCSSFNIGFNREVAADAALYWTKEDGSLSRLIEVADTFTDEESMKLGQKAKMRIVNNYSWQYICDRYCETFKK